MKLHWNHIHHSSMPGTVKEELGICGLGQDYIDRTAKRYLKIPLIITFQNKPRAISSESKQINPKADFSGKEAKGFMGLGACGGRPLSLSKSSLLNEALWQLS